MKRILISSAVLLLLAQAVSFAHVAEQSLNGEWSLKFFPQPAEAVTTPAEAAAVEGTVIAATVPGNVEIDMEAAGLIADPMVGNNIYLLRPYEGYQWCYKKTFASPEFSEEQSVVLSFAGLDTFAEIWLNGEKVGSAANMLIGHEYNVTKLLNKDGDNTLEVIIRSSVLEAQKYFLGPLSIGNFANEEASYVRRAPSTYGWDIMPRLVSAGIWRDVTLRVENPIEIIDANWMTANADPASRSAYQYLFLQTRMPFDAFDNLEADVVLERNGKELVHRQHLMRKASDLLIFDLKDVDLWWPRGYGEPALYNYTIRLVDKRNGTVYDTEKGRMGFRTVKLDLDDVNRKDDPGQFQFIVNGVPVFAKGSNWVPVDALHSRDKKLIPDAFRLMVDMNCNITRCWGGNVYEEDIFFDLCDENGIMVWQDFAMGCSNYPQRDDFAEAIEEEAISVIRRLRNHPSLVLWSGNNEDDQVMAFGRLSAFKLDPNLDRVSREVLKRVCFEFDPSRPYLPSSPYYSPAAYEEGITDESLPENHLWGPRGYYKEPFYTQNPSQFVSEIGYHGCPNRETIEKMFTKECVNPWLNGEVGKWNDEWQTKANRIYDEKFQGGRNDLMTNQSRIIFGEVPEKLDDFIFSSQSVQAEAMKYFVERFRGGRPYRTGIIWWNVRDGWPLLSDAVCDYYNSKKMAYYYLQNVHHDVCCLINDPVDGEYQLKVDNNTLKDAEGKVTVKDITTGKTLYKGEFKSPANCAVKIAGIPVQKGQGMLLITYRVGDKELANHYLYGEPPYSLKDYKTWIKKTGIYDIK